MSTNFSNTLYLCLYVSPPHVILGVRMLLSLVTAFIQLLRDKITNMTLAIAKEFYRARLFIHLSVPLGKLFSCSRTTNWKTRFVVGSTETNFEGNPERQTTITTERWTWPDPSVGIISLGQIVPSYVTRVEFLCYRRKSRGFFVCLP